MFPLWQALGGKGAFLPFAFAGMMQEALATNFEIAAKSTAYAFGLNPDSGKPRDENDTKDPARWAPDRVMRRYMEGSAKFWSFFTGETGHPGWGHIYKTSVNGTALPVKAETKIDDPVAPVVHFKVDRPDGNVPKVLIIPPYAGPYATLMSDTINTLLPACDISIIDWKNAADVPASEGRLDFSDHSERVKKIIQKLGPDVHVLALCEGGFPMISATASLPESEQPLSITDLATAVDSRLGNSQIHKLTKKVPEEMLALDGEAVLPGRAGIGRAVYPDGQVTFNYNMMRPSELAKELGQTWREAVHPDGDIGNVEKTLSRKDVAARNCSLPMELMKELRHNFFYESQLAEGRLKVNGEPVRTQNIQRPWALTVEAETDDVVPTTQTLALHGLLPNIPEQGHRVIELKGTGHFGVFMGGKFRSGVAPGLIGFWYTAAESRGIEYAPLPKECRAVELPPLWDGKVARPVTLAPDAPGTTNVQSDVTGEDQTQPASGRPTVVPQPSPTLPGLNV